MKSSQLLIPLFAATALSACWPVTGPKHPLSEVQNNEQTRVLLMYAGDIKFLTPEEKTEAKNRLADIAFDLPAEVMAYCSPPRTTTPGPHVKVLDPASIAAITVVVGIASNMMVTEYKRQVDEEIERYTHKYDARVTTDTAPSRIPTCIRLTRYVTKYNTETKQDEKIAAFDWVGQFRKSADNAALQIVPVMAWMNRAGARTDPSGKIATKTVIRIEQVIPQVKDGKPTKSSLDILTEEILYETFTLAADPSGEGPRHIRGVDGYAPAPSRWFPTFFPTANVSVFAAVAESGLGKKHLENVELLIDENRKSLTDGLKETIKAVLEKRD